MIADGLRAWVHCPGLEYQGWNFRISDQSPVKLLDVSPDLDYLNSTLQWNRCQQGIKNEATGKVVFWVPEKYRDIFDIQLNEQDLVVCFESKDMFVLDLSHILQ